MPLTCVAWSLQADCHRRPEWWYVSIEQAAEECLHHLHHLGPGQGVSGEAGGGGIQHHNPGLLVHLVYAPHELVWLHPPALADQLGQAGAGLRADVVTQLVLQVVQPAHVLRHTEGVAVAELPCDLQPGHHFDGGGHIADQVGPVDAPGPHKGQELHQQVWVEHVTQPGLGHLAILQTPAQEPEDLSSGAFHGATPEHLEVLGPVELDDAGAPQLKLVQGHFDMHKLGSACLAAGQAIPAVKGMKQHSK